MLQIKNVNLNVSGVALLHNISIELELGKIYGILGPNGAGKTTLFKSMLGLTDYTGEILSESQPVSSQLFGSLIEYPAFYPKLTVAENLWLHARYLKINNPDIKTALEQVNLWEARSKLFSQLSLGMRQRLGIARAFLGNVKYLLLDEPTNELDPASIQEMRELISDLPKHYGMTVMVSSHLLSEIDQMASDVGIIDRGKLIYQGSLQKLHDRAKGSVRIRVLNQPAAVRILEEQGEAYRLEDGVLVLKEREEEQIAALVALLAGRGARITAVTEQQKSLEDIFLALTGKQVSL